MSGWVVLVVVGAVLRFLGVGSVHLAVLASGFGVGWLLGDLFGATALIVAACTAVIAWVLVTLVFKFAGAGPDHHSLGYIWPDSLGFRGHPQAGLQRVTSTMIRVVGAAAGWISVRRLFPKALNLKDSVAAKYICRSAW